MNKVIITTESCSDLRDDMKSEFQIKTIPMHIVFPTESFLDGEIPVEKVYDFFNKTKQVPKTSAVNPLEFTEFFEKLSKENEGAEIIHIGYSSQCSSTFQNALISLEECKNAVVHLIDSRNVSIGAGSIALYLAKFIKNNPTLSIKEIVNKAKEVSANVITSFVPERLDYLVAGGRVSNAAAIGATILKIKPRIDIIDGKLVATKKYRGTMEKVSEKFLEEFIAENDFIKDVFNIVYVPGADLKVVNFLKEKVLERGFNECEVVSTSCVMSTHGGPGAIGLSAIKKM